MDDDYLGFRSYGGEMELHQHDFHQLVLPHTGMLEMEVDGRAGTVAMGKAAFVAAGSSHTFWAGQRQNSFIVADLGFHTIASSHVERFEKAAFFDIGLPLQSLIDYLAAALGKGEAPEILRNHWLALMSHTLFADKADDESRSLRPLERALVFMRRHLADPIAITDIARACGVGQTRLYQIFLEHKQQTPHAVLMQLRLNAALHLLASTSLSIAEIAVRTGHADQSTLTRRLRLSRGVTPSAWRKVKGTPEILAQTCEAFD